ncbi:glycosyltransferase family 2 protein [Cellvibrio sp.]|uniref:glycosyltransferase family 2 protein n=1 Tax=Cellvibrio sp. TaxID=1965322 RepID=UPI0039648922
MPTISAVLIVNNEASTLPDCLKSISWVDEIIILDSGSTDNTVTVAQEFSAKIFTNTDWQGFGVQRERAASYATSDWIFMIDADERVTPELKTAIQSAVTQGDAIWQINRLAWCFGRFIKHSGMHPDWIPRLYPRNKAKFDATRVHERLTNHLNLPVRRLDGVLLHYPFDSIRHQQQKAAHYAEEWALQRAAVGKKTSMTSAVLHALACFIRMYIFRLGFLDGRQGLLLALLLSQSTFVKYAELWQLTHNGNVRS